VSRIRWALQATDDLQAIRDFIGRDSPKYATMVVERIVAAVDILDQFPMAGRMVPLSSAAGLMADRLLIA
jgi:plasmid stabilization system protein ParE